jgi:molybdopterin biosynthesis enzyme
VRVAINLISDWADIVLVSGMDPFLRAALEPESHLVLSDQSGSVIARLKNEKLVIGLPLDLEAASISLTTLALPLLRHRAGFAQTTPLLMSGQSSFYFNPSKATTLRPLVHVTDWNNGDPKLELVDNLEAMRAARLSLADGFADLTDRSSSISPGEQIKWRQFE